MKFLYLISVTFLLLACAGDSKDSKDVKDDRGNNSQLPLAGNAVLISDSDTLMRLKATNVEVLKSYIKHPSNSDVVFTEISQANRGVLSVDSTRRILTYDPKGSLNYLNKGEVYQETITYSAKINNKDITGNIALSVTGSEFIDACTDLPKVTVDFSQKSEHLVQDIQEKYCIQLDASALNQKESRWSAWAGPNGGNASEAFFTYIGREQSNAQLTFLPPNAGEYHLAWCPIDNSECLASARFNVLGKNLVEPKLSLTNNSVANVNSEVNVKAVDSSEKAATDNTLAYRWIVADITDSENIDIVLDILSYSSSVNFTSPKNNSNLNMLVIASDDYFNVNSQGFRSSFAGGNNYSVPRGLYDTSTTSLYVRDPDGPKPPKSKLVVTGDTLSHVTEVEDDATLHEIKMEAGQSLVFDGASSSDVDSDTLEYRWIFYKPNGAQESIQTTSSITYTPAAGVESTGQDIDFCVSDGFPWRALENPCHEIHINVEE